MTLTEAFQYVADNGNDFAKCYAEAALRMQAQRLMTDEVCHVQILYIRSNITSNHGKQWPEVKRLFMQYSKKYHQAYSG